MSSGGSVCFRQSEMLKHYEQFDPIQFKYDISGMVKALCDKEATELSDLLTADELKEWNPQDSQSNLVLHGDLLKHRLTNYLRHYEAVNDITSLTKRDFSHVMANLHMIYHANWKEVNCQARLIDLVSKRVISEYIGIDGLERLFSDQYIDFEWEMHLGMDHSEYKMDFYRDHFIHQVRDAYMLELLLKENRLYRPTLETLCRPSASKVSQYFRTMVERQQLVDHGSSIEKYLRLDTEFIPRNIIKMAAYMAGIFHDIGYPETHLRSLQRRFSKYMPSIAAVNRQQSPIDDRFPLLQNSLLFRVVPLREIQERANRNKVDHGTLSALAFLLHFYENGIIFRLEPYKAAAIELAALAIYNHTYKYAVSEKPDTETDDCRARFISNPISYLLRICDDLQEWDRIYFEISSRSNILICPRCQTPIIGLKEADEADEERCRYVCSCSSTGSPTQFRRAFDGRQAFRYRRVYNVSVCDEVVFEPLDEGKNGWGEISDIVAHLHYEPYRLLHIAYISPGYARYRIKELNKLKPLLMRQSPLPRLWLDYFVTANPILIKTRLLSDFFRGKSYKLGLIPKNSTEEDVKGRLNAEREKLSTYTNTFIDRQFSENQALKEFLKHAISLYTDLFLYQMLHFQEKSELNNPAWITACMQLEKEISQTYKGSEEFRCLLGDSLLQLSRIYPKEVLVHQTSVPLDYLEQFEPGNWKERLGSFTPCSPDFYYAAVERYTDQQNYKPLNSKSSPREIDAFIDLGFFNALFEHELSKHKI